jgi:hypothetical protein
MAMLPRHLQNKQVPKNEGGRQILHLLDDIDQMTLWQIAYDLYDLWARTIRQDLPTKYVLWDRNTKRSINNCGLVTLYVDENREPNVDNSSPGMNE